MNHRFINGLLRLRPVLSDKIYLRILFYKFMGKRLNLSNPTTFNEKLQWLKLYDRKPIYSKYVDKDAVKEVVESKLGTNENIIPTLAKWENIEDIDFTNLPDRFVIKLTHDSGGVFIVHDKKTFDLDAIKDKLKKSLSRNFYDEFKEWPYKNVPPLIIAEQYIENADNPEDLNDYKFFCFNGEPKFFKIDFDRQTNHGANYYDLNWNRLPFGEVICPPNPNRQFSRPKNFDKMIEIARKLAEGTKFIRIDLYNIQGKILFGEMTFFPAAGLGKFTDEEWDIKIGNMIKLD
ncbi:MAG: glycosyl transferase [Bacteroides sp.]|nr:glycosyl transferase [Bacteroides sp.]MBD5307451.1 glycosyl transferase [Bacteroides sp.]